MMATTSSVFYKFSFILILFLSYQFSYASSNNIELVRESTTNLCDAALSANNRFGKQLFILPGALTEAAEQENLSVLEYLEKSLLHNNPLAIDGITLGPLDGQTVAGDFEIGYTGYKGDSIGTYNSCQYIVPGEVCVDSQLGTDAQLQQLITTLKSQGQDVFVDFVAQQVGYFPVRPQDQQHYLKFLKQKEIELPTELEMVGFVEKAKQEKLEMPEDGTLKQQFVATHIYLPWVDSGRWVSRADNQVFVGREGVSEEAYDIFETAEPDDPRLAEAKKEIQEKELWMLPKLNFNNSDTINALIMKVQNYAARGVNGFRIDAAKHINEETLVILIRTMIDSVKKYNSSVVTKSEPKVVLEYWTKNRNRLREIQETLNDRLGDEYFKYIWFYDQNIAFHIRSLVSTEIDFYNFVNKQKFRTRPARRLSNQVPIVFDHDMLRPLWDGNESGIIKSAVINALTYFISTEHPILYNSSFDVNFGPQISTAPFHSHRHQSRQLVESDNKYFATLNSQHQLLDNFIDRGLFNLPIRIYTIDENHLLVSRNLIDGNRAILIISKHQRLDFPQFGNSIWNYEGNTEEGTYWRVQIFENQK